MSGHGTNGPAHTARAVIWRGIGLLVLWIVLAGTGPAELPVGIVVALLALAASLVLLPPAQRRFRPLPLIQLVARLLYDSVIAGADVAARALRPQLDFHPGFVRYRPGMPAGPALTTFTTLMSLVPGTLPAGSEPDGTLIIHCLDVKEPVAAALAREEAKLRRVLEGSGNDG